MAAEPWSAAHPRRREFDIVIFGASGFTGKYVVREALLRVHPNPDLAFALAGRSLAKMATALSWASSAAGLASPPHVALIQADSSDPSSLLHLARRTSLLLNCAGPFRRLGSPVVAACVAAGTNYLDVSGEPDFMERVEAEYHDKASAAGSLVVSACGFVSIPAELGLMWNSRQWGPEGALNRVEAYVSLESKKRTVLNLGSYETLVLWDANIEGFKSRTKRTTPQIPGPAPPKGSLMEHQRFLRQWALKLPACDTSVVGRTLAILTENQEGLPGVDESLEHAEKRKKFWSTVKPAHFGVKIATKSILGIFQLILTGVFIGLFGKFSFGRSLLLKFPEVFSLGWFRKAGPTEEQVNSATFKMWFVGHGYSDTSLLLSQRDKKPDTEIVTRVSGPEVAYIATSIILIQCALTVLKQRGNLPKGGVYTPGIVFGHTDLQGRLQQHGFSFDVISKKPLMH